MVTVGWAAFVMYMVKWTMTNPNPINVVELSGVSVLLGALIVWNGNVNQFWFRKKPPKYNSVNPNEPNVPPV
jgi:hypothetical protein